MVVHPVTRAAITAASPTAPAPVTAIEEPAGGRSSFRTDPAPVFTPQPSGARASSGTDAGTGVRLVRATLA